MRQLNVVGVGAIRLNSSAAAATASPAQPLVIADLRGFVYKALNSLVGLGVRDLQDRSFASAYPCTRSTLQWKPPVTIVFVRRPESRPLTHQVLIGSCLGPFGGILTVLLLVGAYYEASEAQRATARLRRRIDPLGGEFVDQLRTDSRPSSFASFADYKDPYHSPEATRYSRVIDESFELPISPPARQHRSSSSYL